MAAADGTSGDRATFAYPKGADTMYDKCVSDPPEWAGGRTDLAEPEHPNVLVHVVKSLMPGQDLTRVTIPSFFLENRSLLEKLGDILMHPHLLIKVPQLEDPFDRIVQVVKWFLSGWHYKTVGVKKPYNPVVGETFACQWRHEDGSRSQYLAEQVSHRPPISALYFENNKHSITASAVVWTKSKFKAPQTAVSMMVGGVELHLTETGEKYHLTMPDFMAHGLLVGTLRMEVSGSVKVVCPTTGYSAVIDFKPKPMVGGDYNVVATKIIDPTGKKVADITGKWDKSFDIIDRRVKKAKPTLFLDTRTEPIMPKHVLPLSEQGPWESRRLWSEVTQKLDERPEVDWMAVDRMKGKLEDAQRLLACHQEGGEPWMPKLFHEVPLHNPLTGEDEMVYRMDYRATKPYADGDVENNLIALSRLAADERTGDAEPFPGVGDGAADSGASDEAPAGAGADGSGGAAAGAGVGAGGAAAGAGAAGDAGVTVSANGGTTSGSGAGAGAAASGGGESSAGAGAGAVSATPAAGVPAPAAATSPGVATEGRPRLPSTGRVKVHKPTRVDLV